MQMNKKRRILVIAVNALMIAMYVVLSLYALPLGGTKITFEHFPVVLSAILYGPAAGMVVGGLGEFINQLFTFGVTPTTALWILPIVARGLLVGISTKIFKKRFESPIIFGLVCVVSGVISSLLNTFALYVDSKMFGYYSVALVFGALAMRLVLSVVTSLVIAIVTKPILHALRKAHLI